MGTSFFYFSKKFLAGSQFLREPAIIFPYFSLNLLQIKSFFKNSVFFCPHFMISQNKYFRLVFRQIEFMASLKGYWGL